MFILQILSASLLGQHKEYRVAAIRATVSPGFSMAHPPCVNPEGVTRDWSLRPVKPSWFLVVFGCLFAVYHRLVKTLALLQGSLASVVSVNFCFVIITLFIVKNML